MSRAPKTVENMDKNLTKKELEYLENAEKAALWGISIREFIHIKKDKRGEPDCLFFNSLQKTLYSFLNFTCFQARSTNSDSFSLTVNNRSNGLEVRFLSVYDLFMRESQFRCFNWFFTTDFTMFCHNYISFIVLYNSIIQEKQEKSSNMLNLFKYLFEKFRPIL